MFQRTEALRVADKQIPTRLEAGRHAIDHLGLRLAVEIDHHIAAEDDVVGVPVLQRLRQVQAAKLDGCRDFRLHLVPALPVAFTLQKETPAPMLGYLLETV